MCLVFKLIANTFGTTVPLPYCVNIATVQAASGSCYDQIKEFVNDIKLTLSDFIGNQIDNLQRHSIFDNEPDTNGTKNYEMLVEEIITKLNGSKTC